MPRPKSRKRFAEVGPQLDHCLVPGRWEQGDADVCSWDGAHVKGQDDNSGAQSPGLPSQLDLLVSSDFQVALCMHLLLLGELPGCRGESHHPDIREFPVLTALVPVISAEIWGSIGGHSGGSRAVSRPG